VLTFVELGPDGAPPPGAESDEEPLTERRPAPAWWPRVRRYRYLAGLAVLLGGVLVGDPASVLRAANPTTTPGPTAAGYVYADRGHCPRTVGCDVIGRARQDLWASYDELFPTSHTVGGSVWYEPTTGQVYFQQLEALGPDAETITLTQQRISGPPISFGATIDRTPSPRHSVLVTARRGPWLITARLYAPRGTRLPVMAAVRWVTVAPLPE